MLKYSYVLVICIMVIMIIGSPPESLLKSHIHNINELNFPFKIVHSYVNNNNRWTLYVLGDSHAQQFFPDFIRLEKIYKINIIDKTGDACMLAEGMTYINPKGRIMRNCQQAYSNYIRYFETHKDKNVLIFMGARYMAYLSNTMIAKGQKPVDGLLLAKKNVFIRNSGNKLQKIYLKSLENTIRKLYKKNIPVIFLAPYAELPSSTIQCIYKPKAFSCGIAKKINRERIKFFMKGIIKISHLYPNFHIFNPFNQLCPSKICSNIMNKKALYRDTDHLTAYSISRLYPRLEKLILNIIKNRSKNN